ncbi:MAG: polynucleotide adenylyltransferase PcnB [Deltaproteobacteria bacterium]|nr:polynucleotide adenylyltransferase PcnB [Deltaproteobacteria bacterium]
MNQTSKLPKETAEQPLLMGPRPPDVHISFVRKQHQFPESSLDLDALKVVRRLRRFGHETYLVGGCIRDLLLGAVPKDFDVVTSAKPAEIKALFRNCRLIGRRFRLAHLHFKEHKIIEVATFRREPLDSDDLSSRHAAGNLFGTAADDAVRRDFTVNALMYDVEKGEILDWVGGLADIDDGIIRAIGHPERRLPEDPVRIIRAIKFAAKLNLNIDPVLAEEMCQSAPLMAECSKARLLEELFKILRSGFAATCMRQLQSTGAMKYLLPDFQASLEQVSYTSWTLLEKADALVRDGFNASDAFLLAVFLYPALEELIWEANDVAKAVSAALKPIAQPLQFTKKNMATVRNAYISQRRMVKGPRNKRTRRLVERDFIGEALDLLEITERAPTSIIESWRKLLMRQINQRKNVGVRPRSRRRRPPVRKTRTPRTVDNSQ